MLIVVKLYPRLWRMLKKPNVETKSRVPHETPGGE
jgi:hypothetical protein